MGSNHTNAADRVSLQTLSCAAAPTLASAAATGNCTSKANNEGHLPPSLRLEWPSCLPAPTTSRLVRSDGFQPTIPAFFQSPTLGTRRPGGTKGDRDGLNLNCSLASTKTLVLSRSPNSNAIRLRHDTGDRGPVGLMSDKLVTLLPLESHCCQAIPASRAFHLSQMEKGF